MSNSPSLYYFWHLIPLSYSIKDFIRIQVFILKKTSFAFSDADAAVSNHLATDSVNVPIHLKAAYQVAYFKDPALWVMYFPL